MKKLLSAFLILLIICLGVIPSFAANKVSPYAVPLYKYNARIYSDAYELIDMDDPNYQVLAAKNITKRKYPASLTKIVTVMVALKNTKNIKKTTTVRSSTLRSLNNTGAQVAYLKAGQKVTIEQLMYLSMVYSACDASRVLADAVSGSNTAFVKKMNAWARSIGCKNTHFVNPDGLHHPKHYTTVADLRMIMKEACKNKTFLKISSATSYTFNKIKFAHTNKMLNKSRYEYYKFARGIKTGYTRQAKQCVITYANNGSKRYLVICLNAPLISVKNRLVNGAYADARALFNWSYKQFKVRQIIKANQSYKTILVNQGDGVNTLTLCFKTGVSKLIYGSYDSKKLVIKPIKMPASISAPVTAGKVICNAQIYYGGTFVKTVPLIANKTIKVAQTEPETTQAETTNSFF